MSNFRHVNFGSDLLPVDSSGVAVDNTLNLGSSSKRWGIGFFNNAYFSGNVGIGAQSVASLGTSITTLGIRGGTTARTGGLYLDSSDSSVKFAMYGATSDSATLPFALGTTTNHGFRFVANNANVGCVDASGNFGIGTTSPAYKLDVQSGFGVIARFNFNDATYNPRLAISGSSSGIMFNLDYSTAASNIMFGIGGTEYFRFNSAGLGIGTTTVSAKLHVISTGTIFRGGYDASNYIGLQVGSTGDATFSLAGTAPKFQFSNRMEITPSSASGIQEALRLIDLGSGSSEGAYIRWDSQSRTDMARIGALGEITGGGLSFYTNSANSGTPTLNAYLSPSGNFGIGVSTISARLQSVSTTEQFRFGYDLSNYGSISSDSVGLISISGSLGVVSIPSQHKVRAYKTSAQSISSGSTGAAVTFDSEDYDTGGLHSTSANTERITAVYDGNYIFNATVEFEGASAGTFIYTKIVLRKNGTEIKGAYSKITNGGAGAVGGIINVSSIVPMVAGDYVDVVAIQTSGSTMNIAPTSGVTAIEAIKVS